MATQNKNLAVVILAAGVGTRMKSSLPKVMHKIAGKPMVLHALDTARALGAEKIITVIGPAMEDARDAVAPHPITVQERRLGTGDAVKAALPELKGFSGDVLILYGDVPLVSEQSLQALLDHHRTGNFGASVLAMAPPDASGYGRIVQNPDGTLKAIIEEKDASAEEKMIRLCNSGIMVIAALGLEKNISAIKNDNAQGEYYLVDIVTEINRAGGQCGVIRGDYRELRGVNTRSQLAELESFAQDILRHRAMDNGATLIDPRSVYLSADTQIGRDVILHPGVVIGPGVRIGDGAEILPYSHVEGAVIGAGASIGPFARIRPGSTIGEDAEVGNFTEVNRSALGQGVKAKHVSYLGDAQIGAESNIAAGTVIANYDGFFKHKTVLGENVSTGCNCTLVAPVKVGEGSIIAAGSTIDQDVPPGALAIAREDVEIKKDWAKKYRAKKSKEKAAKKSA